MDDMNYLPLEDIGIEIVEMAQELFNKCGSIDDFCWQSGLTFGGTNRVTLGINGWIASGSHCTERFLQEFDKHCYTRKC